MDKSVEIALRATLFASIPVAILWFMVLCTGMLNVPHLITTHPWWLWFFLPLHVLPLSIGAFLFARCAWELFRDGTTSIEGAFGAIAPTAGIGVLLLLASLVYHLDYTRRVAARYGHWHADVITGIVPTLNATKLEVDPKEALGCQLYPPMLVLERRASGGLLARRDDLHVSPYFLPEDGFPLARSPAELRTLVVLDIELVDLKYLCYVYVFRQTDEGWAFEDAVVVKGRRGQSPKPGEMSRASTPGEMPHRTVRDILLASLNKGDDLRGR